MAFGKFKRALLRTILGEDVFAPKWTPTPILQTKFDDKLVCYGCAHSVGGGEPYPGRPSGERPCMFCVRNPNQARDLADVQAHAPGFVSPRYDNKPVSTIPADQYIATDRLMRDLPEGTIAFT